MLSDVTTLWKQLTVNVGSACGTDVESQKPADLYTIWGYCNLVMKGRYTQVQMYLVKSTWV